MSCCRDVYYGINMFLYGKSTFCMEVASSMYGNSVSSGISGRYGAKQGRSIVYCKPSKRLQSLIKLIQCVYPER